MRSRFGARVTWLPFDLHPEYPPEGRPRPHRESDGRLRASFEEEGLVFNPPDVMPNSRAALRLSELARDAGLHEPFHHRLMDAIWAEARDLGDHETLFELAEEVGLERAAAERVLAGNDYEARVLASTAEAQSIGITGIPAFLLDSQLLVLGAYPRATFERAFAQLEAQRPT